MSRTTRRCRTVIVLLALLAVVLPLHFGCASKPKAPPKPATVKALRLMHQLGGTHYRTIIDGDFCYQTFDRNLLVLAAGQVTPLKTIELGTRGETGPAVDMVLLATNAAKRLWIVIEDDEVLELALDLPQAPSIVQRVAAARLGIRPRRLSIVGGELYVSGPGGIVRIRDNHKIFTADVDVSRVAQADSGLVACIGRQAIRLSDGKYVGSATDFATPTSQHLVFIRQGDEGGLVGLMSPQVREVDTHHATVAVPGTINSVRTFNDQLWIATDRTTVGYRMTGDALSDPIYIDVLGANDVAQIDDHQMAIAGTFGRAMYRLTQSEKGEPPGFTQIHREPSRLSMAVTDGRHILAGSVEGLWMYLINSRVDLTNRQFENAPPPPQTIATVATGTAKISDDRRDVTITSNAIDPTTGKKVATTWDFRALAVADRNTSIPDGLIHCIEAIDGDFWIGHDRGISVIKAPAPPLDEKTSKKEQQAAQAATNTLAGRIRFDGPVLYIYPLLVGGGASFVSEFGGFGVAKFVEEPISQPAPKSN